MPLFKLSAKGTVIKRKRNGLREWKTWSQQVHEAVYLGTGVGLFTGIGLATGIIAITQSWFGWGW